MFSIFSDYLIYLFHILCMTCIMYGYCFTIYGVCVVPLASMSHIPLLPSIDYWFTP